jgi:hypothetical protein
MKQAVFISAAMVLCSTVAWAQDENWSKFTVNVGVGVANPVHDTGSRLDTGYSFTGGAGMNFTRHLGIVGEFTYNSFGVNPATLQALEFPNGEMRLWAFTANPVVRLNRSGKVDFYLIGGGGVYHRVLEFTQPTVATYTAYDPFLAFSICRSARDPSAEFILDDGGWAQHRRRRHVQDGARQRESLRRIDTTICFQIQQRRSCRLLLGLDGD